MEFNLSAKEFLEKFITMLASDSQEKPVLNYKQPVPNVMEIWIHYKGFFYHTVITTDDLSILYTRNEFDETQKWNMFRQEVMDKMQNIQVN